MKNLPVFTIVIALCLGAAVAMIQSDRGSNGWQSYSIQTTRASSAPYRDGLYLGTLAAAGGGEPRVSSGRWSREADRASFTAGFQQGYDARLVLRASKGSMN